MGTRVRTAMTRIKGDAFALKAASHTISSLKYRGDINDDAVRSFCSRISLQSKNLEISARRIFIRMDMNQRALWCLLQTNRFHMGGFTRMINRDNGWVQRSLNKIWASPLKSWSYMEVPDPIQ